MKKVLISSLITLIAGVAIGYIVTPKRNKAHENLLESLAKIEINKRKEAEAKMHYWMSVDSVWRGVTHKYRDSIQTIRKHKAKTYYIYANIGSVDPPKWSDAELDTLISAIIR